MVLLIVYLLTGLTGDILMNENGDREVDYTLNDLDPETGTMRPVATYFGSRRIMDKFPGVEIHWPKNKGPPPNVPDCGFMGEAPHCLPKGMRKRSNIHSFLTYSI